MYLFELLYTYTPHLLQVTLRKKVTHNITEIICSNIPYENINNIPDLNGQKRNALMRNLDFRIRHNHASNAWPLASRANRALSRDRTNLWKYVTKLINTWVFARLSQSWATAWASNKSSHCRTLGHCLTGTLNHRLRRKFPTGNLLDSLQVVC